VNDQVARFEDRRWSMGDQVPVWRHRAAVQLVRNEPILDIGGGDGLLLRMLRERGFRQLALADLSSVAVEKVRSAGFQADVLDVTDGLPFSESSFGTVCALDVLEHLYDPLPPLREMARVGRDVVIVVPNFQYWRERMDMLRGRTPFQSQPARGHIHWFDPDGLHALIDEAGLRVEEELREAPVRLGPLGSPLAAWRPSLFASSIGVRVRRISASR
jgi:methionine biosynthesis protein MetW